MRLLAATLVSFLCVPVDALRPSTRADGLRMSGSGDTAINRRAALLRPALFATGVASIPLVANAGDLYVTQEEFCKRTMTERGASYGCESFVIEPAKRAAMVARSQDKFDDARARLERIARKGGGDDADGAAAAAAFGLPQAGNALRGELRDGSLGSVRKEGKRLVTFSAPAGGSGKVDAALEKSYTSMLRAVDALDGAARRVEQQALGLDGAPASADETAAAGAAVRDRLADAVREIGRFVEASKATRTDR